MQFFAAHGAGVIDRQIPAEQRTAATLGTFAFPPFSTAGMVGRSALLLFGLDMVSPLVSLVTKWGQFAQMSSRRVVANKFQKFRRKLWALRLLL